MQQYICKGERSHPKEKSGQEATDPTPKRNLVKEWWIPPRREIWSGSDGSHPEEKKRKKPLTVLCPVGFAAGKKAARSTHSVGRRQTSFLVTMQAPRIFFRGKIVLNQLQEGYLHTSLSIPCLWGQPQARTCEGKGKFQFYSISANITSQSTKNSSLCPVPLCVVGDHLDHEVVHRHHLVVVRAAAAAAAGGSHQGGAHCKVGLVGGEQAELVPPAAGVVAWRVNIFI